MDLDVVRLKLSPQLVSKLLESAFGAGVGSHARNSLLYNCRVTNQSDTTSITTEDHALSNGMHEVQDAVEVEVHVVAERGHFGRQKHRRFAYSCAANNEVDRTSILVFDLCD